MTALIWNVLAVANTLSLKKAVVFMFALIVVFAEIHQNLNWENHLFGWL
jgi:hypothetical protein